MTSNTILLGNSRLIFLQEFNRLLQIWVQGCSLTWSKTQFLWLYGWPASGECSTRCSCKQMWQHREPLGDTRSQAKGPWHCPHPFRSLCLSSLSTTIPLSPTSQNPWKWESSVYSFIFPNSFWGGEKVGSLWFFRLLLGAFENWQILRTLSVYLH